MPKTKEVPFLKVGELKKMLQDIPDNTEVYIRCCVNPFGNIVEAGIADKSSRGFFGMDIPCVIIEPADEGYAIKKKQKSESNN